MHHTYVHRSHVYQDRYMHHTCMYHDQICFSFINHTCIRLLESPCSSVRPSVPKKYRIIYTAYIHNRIICRFVQCASYICASHIYDSGSIIYTQIIEKMRCFMHHTFRIKAQDHFYVHNTHICIRINDRGT